MNKEQEAVRIIRELARNATQIKLHIVDCHLQEAARLTGERVTLIEALRALRDAKVSLASSDRMNEMTALMKNIENDVSEANANIRARMTSLTKELATITGARKIAAYAAMRHPAHATLTKNEQDKIRGGRHGY